MPIPEELVCGPNAGGLFPGDAPSATILGATEVGIPKGQGRCFTGIARHSRALSSAPSLGESSLNEASRERSSDLKRFLHQYDDRDICCTRSSRHPHKPTLP